MDQHALFLILFPLSPQNLNPAFNFRGLAQTFPQAAPDHGLIQMHLMRTGWTTLETPVSKGENTVKHCQVFTEAGKYGPTVGAVSSLQRGEGALIFDYFYTANEMRVD